MAPQECNTLVAYLRKIPDPRGKQGRQFAWWHLLGIVCWATLCGQKVVRGIWEWAQAHAALILEAWGEELPRLPSESTLRRALRYIDVEQLARQMAAFDQHMAAYGPAPSTAATGGWEGQALDGKEVRGANTHGAQLHLVSLVEQRSGTVLSQQAVPAKTNESKAAPALLRGHDLHGVVITGDALLTQRPLAQQILDQGGHYLMVVKRNQAELYEDIRTLFAEMDWGPDDDRWSYTSRDRGHGRYETRTLTTSEHLWRGHWSIENRTQTWRCVPQALRHYAAHSSLALAAIGVPFS